MRASPPNPVRLALRLTAQLGLATGTFAGVGCFDAAPAWAQVEPENVAPAEPDTAPASAPAAEFDKRWLEPFFAKEPLRTAAERFRLEQWGPAADALEKALKKTPKKTLETSPEHLAARYLLALAKENQSLWSEAGGIFEELYEKHPRLAPYHAYHAARCRLRRGDALGALAWVDKVPGKTVPEAEAVLVRLDALTSLGRWAELADESRAFLERFKQGPRRAEAQFHLGEALERLARPVQEIVAVYRRIWAEAPTEPWARRAEDRIDALTAALPPATATPLRTPTAPELVTRGMAFFERNQNAEAESTLAAALGAPGLDAYLECRAKFHRAQSVFKQRQRPRAAPLFAQAEAACRALGDRDLTVKSLYQGGRCLASASDVTGALTKYEEIERSFPEHSYADDARLRAAELATETGDLAKAAILYEEIPTRYPRGDLAGEALFRLAFRAFQEGQNDRALALFDRNLEIVPREEIWYAEGRAHYWKARLYQRLGMPESARASYQRAIREYPLSVYALLSLERMREAFPEDRVKVVKELRKELAGKDGLPIELERRPIYGDATFLRAVELARMGLGSDARRELAFIGFRAPEGRDAARSEGRPDASRADVLWVTAVLLDRGRVFSASHSIPRYSMADWRTGWPAGRGEAAWRIAYPRAFPEIVDSHSRKNRVPTALQLAIMREESAFNPRIESFANALGLTQMLVRTAQRFSETRVTRETLLEPASNVALGSRFLSFLLERYGGAAPLAIAGYNAGEGAVDRWLKERGQLPLDEFMELIPFDETRGYTKRVLASYLAYSWLYDDKAPIPRLDFSLDEHMPRKEPERQGRRARR